MSATVIVNGQTVVHAKSDGSSTASPDVCWTPPHVPVPYVNVAYSRDATETAATVSADGCAIMIRHSCFGTSTGDEGGTAGGGIISGVIKGKATFTNYSFDVFAEGENVPRRLDPMGQNHGSPFNTFSPAEIQPNLQTAVQIICLAICLCHWLAGAPANIRNSVLRGLNLGGVADFMSKYADQLLNMGKQVCVDTLLSMPRITGGGVYHDPYFPNINPEVPFDMTTSPPSALMSSSQKSLFWKDAAGNARPLPRSYPGFWMFSRSAGTTRIPDVIITHNPQLPPTGSNIARVVEIKFPGDDWRPGQREAYREIDPNHQDPLVLSPKACGCELELSPEDLLAIAAILTLVAAAFLAPEAEPILGPALGPAAIPLLQRLAPSLVPLLAR